MPKQRKHYSPELKAKVALEAIKGQQTVNEIASRYAIHPNLVSNRLLSLFIFLIGPGQL